MASTATQWGFSASKGVTGYFPTDVFETGKLTDYKWIVVIGCFGMMYTAWGLGANDLANSFGTTVGSKTLKIWQVVIIAGIFEFLGAFFLGSTVTDTISSKIVNPLSFVNKPELYMYGMMMVDWSAALWLNLATALELPVSSTHSAVGAVIGFGLVNNGNHGILWNVKIPDFPYRAGVTPIVISWFTSPIIAAVFSGCLYLIVRTAILRRRNSFKIACFLVPVIFFGVVMTNVVFVLLKGAKFLIGNDNKPLKADCVSWINARTIDSKKFYGYTFAASCIKQESTKSKFFPTAASFGAAGSTLPAGVTAKQIYDDYTVAYPKTATGYCCRKVNVFSAKGWLDPAAPSAFCGGVVAIAAFFYIWFYLKPRIEKHFVDLAIYDAKKKADLEAAAVVKDSEYATGETAKKADSDSDKGSDEKVDEASEPLPPVREFRKFFRVASKKAVRTVFAGAVYNIHEISENENHKDFDPRAKHMHDILERYDPATEKLFEYLQVFSACAMSFAHGANDVANAVGPFTGVWSVYKFRRINTGSVDLGTDIKWILALGAISLVTGLATYGHYILRALGVKLASITPSRGFVMETCTSITITFASAYGLPVSTTHCQVGSTSGTGFVDSPRHGVNWPFLGRMFVGWVVTLIATGFCSAALFSQGVYAPNTYMAKDRESYQKFIGAAVKTLLNGAIAHNASVTDAQVAAAGFGSRAEWLTQLSRANATNDKLNFERFTAVDKNAGKSSGSITAYTLSSSKPYRVVQYFYAGDQNVVLENAVKALLPFVSA